MTNRITIKTDTDAISYLGSDPSNGTGTVIVKDCGRCGGTGYWSKGHPVANGVCFRCKGDGNPVAYSLVEFAKRARKAELRHARAEARREAQRAAAEERQAQWEAEQAKKRAEREAKRAEERAQSDYIGNKGERFTVAVTVLCARLRDGNWGATTWFLLKTDDGNLITWNASGAFDVEHGDRLALTATVKDHRTWNDARQTVATRGKLADLAA